ncbi:ankyrin [Apiospora saccharicola]|uniref:Ankyrin n=1 Tax=Apiospora saccharicola TaxID=335842 RepID=A0ABR1U7U7_9PEZI
MNELRKNVADASETVLTLQWVLLSQRPLNPQELFAAVVRTALPTIDLVQRRITTAFQGLGGGFVIDTGSEEEFKLEKGVDAGLIYTLVLNGLPKLLGAIAGKCDVDAYGGHYDNALQAASAAGMQEVVRLLLEEGADVNAEGDLYCNALHALRREIFQADLDLNSVSLNTFGGMTTRFKTLDQAALRHLWGIPFFD